MIKDIIQVGNSRGIILPKKIIDMLNLDSLVKIEIKDNKIILRKPKKNEKI